MLSIIEHLKPLAALILEKTVYSANKEYGRSELCNELKNIVPDLSNQYTTFDVNTPLLVAMVRCLHAFQVSLVQIAWGMINKESLNVVDIGDSSGIHLMYLQSKEISGDRKIKALSVNLDPVAVSKIHSKGLQAIQCRAEELIGHPDYGNQEVDVFLSFETLEHLFDPISFMKTISDTAGDTLFVVTVPYLKKSRVAIHQIRRSENIDMYAENTHIFELCPSDWRLIFNLSGWEIVYDEIYKMYPRKNILFFASILWKRFAFNGHYGCILKKNDKYKSRYKSW